jgi:thioredoxin-related protein
MVSRETQKLQYGSMRFVFLLIGLLFISPGLVARAWKTSLQDALAEAQKSNAPVFVDVHAEWCGYCKKLQKEVFPDPLFVKASEKYILLSIDGEKVSSFASRYNITSYPTLLVLDKNGAEISRVDGFVNAGRLSELLNTSYAAKDKEAKLNEQLKRNPDDPKVNFEAGVYYADRLEHQKARTYFLHSWNSSSGDMVSRMNSLYNAAVSSMELQDYLIAVSLWNAYLALDGAPAKDKMYARLYRGLSLKYAGKSEPARKDLEWAVQHLPPPDNQAARRVLDEL